MAINVIDVLHNYSSSFGYSCKKIEQKSSKIFEVFKTYSFIYFKTQCMDIVKNKTIINPLTTEITIADQILITMAINKVFVNHALKLYNEVGILLVD